MNKAQELRSLSEESKRKSKEELDKFAVDNMYEQLLCVMKSMTVFGHTKYKLTQTEELIYGLDEDWIRKEILSKLMVDGFVVNRGSSGWMSRIDFLQISWE